MQTKEEKIQEIELRERIEHQNVLLALGVLLRQKEGVQLFNYLFKEFDVACVPEIGMEGQMLFEYLGFLRAGNAIYKLVCEADYSIAATILSKLEKDRYDRLYIDSRLE